MPAPALLKKQVNCAVEHEGPGSVLRHLPASWFWNLCVAGWFGLFFLYTWLRVEPVLQHYATNPVFLLSSGFYQEHLSYPGGPLQYLAAFLMEFYRVSWLGALLTTVLALGLGLLADSLCPRAGCRRSFLPIVAPGALLLIAQADYEYSWSAPSLAIAAALGCSAIYGLALEHRWSVRLAAFTALAIPLYYAICGGYVWFATTCALLELARRTRAENESGCGSLPRARAGSFWLILFFLVTAMVLPYIAAATVFVVSLRDAYVLHLPPGPTGLSRVSLAALGALVPGLLLAFALWRIVLRPAQQAGGGAPSGCWRRWVSKLRGNCTPAAEGTSVLWLVVAAGCCLLSFSPQEKFLARIEFLAQQERWSELAELGPRLRLASSAAISDINRALCHTHRLLEEMFRSPQLAGYDLWLNPGPNVPRNKMQKASEILFELGHINRAERMAGEALEFSGYQPATLKRLFLASILKGEPRSGIPFLNVLAQSPWQKDWAAGYRRQLESDPGLSSDLSLRQVREFMLVGDYVGSQSVPALLQACLRQDASNRMAADYLYASYLLNRQLAPIAQTLARMNYPDKTALPRHLEEAFLLAELVGKKLDLPGVRFNPATVQRFKAFQLAYAPYQRNPLGAEALLRPGFGDTYWYFYIYGHSGAIMATRNAAPAK